MAMCDRYFIEFPPQEPVTPDGILEESLALLHPKDIQLHRTLFLLPFEPRREQPDKKRLWSRGQRRAENEAAANLRHNIRYMIKKTKHFGLLLSQLTWVGLLNFAEKRRVLQHGDDNLGAAALYIIMLKKETSGLTQFINCLHMTGNHEIANVIEAKLELLVEKFGYCEHSGQCTVSFETSLEEWHGHHLPPKKRKTSADSGFDDTDDEDDDDDDENEEEDDSDSQEFDCSLAASRRYKCNIKPLDAVDVIAIINGREDSRSKVELCKCGHYHQFPKWKDVHNDQGHASVTKENIYSVSTSSSCSESGIGKYFARRGCPDKRGGCGNVRPRQSILSPVTQPVEMGSDLSNVGADLEDPEFTQPRRSCPQLKLRFSNTNGFAEHPDNIQEGEVSSSGESPKSLKSRLPGFLRRLFV